LPHQENPIGETALKLKVYDDKYSIIQFPADFVLPDNLLAGCNFISVTVTPDEISVVCPTGSFTESPKYKTDDGWIMIKIDEILDFSLIGIISKISAVLGGNGIGIFAVSTYNTDYIFIKEQNREKAMRCLSGEFEIVT
jgi:uncharacterized protein